MFEFAYIFQKGKIDRPVTNKSLKITLINSRKQQIPNYNGGFLLLWGSPVWSSTSIFINNLFPCQIYHYFRLTCQGSCFYKIVLDVDKRLDKPCQWGLVTNGGAEKRCKQEELNCFNSVWLKPVKKFWIH